jgi:hypothetical protein
MRRSREAVEYGLALLLIAERKRVSR